MEDQEHNIWMGSKGSGLYLLKKQDTGKYSVHHYQYNPEEPYSISGNDVYTIFQDTRNLIKQTGNGEIQFINCNNELKNYPTTYGTKIRNIAGGPEGVIFVGTTSGLITFASDFKRPEEIKFYRNNHRTGDTHSLNANDIMQIYTDRHNTTYVMSFTGGVNKIISGPLLGEDIQFKGYDKKDGLASDLMLSMIEDNSGQLWFVSEIALSKFNPDKETFENYQLNSTYQDFNFSEALPVINARHQIVLGTDKGFLEVMPDKMKKSSYVPPIIFTNLRIQGHPVEQSIDNLAELELKASQRNVTFQFAALDYVAPEHIQYAYRLEGLEKEWNEAGNNRSASYINLPAGEYRLQVKSTNSDGVWTDNIYSLPVRVLPTFWETYWAWVFYSMLFILFTATIVYVLFYIYRLRHRVDMEKQLTDIKLRFFTDISHELRTPLTLIHAPLSRILKSLSTEDTQYLPIKAIYRQSQRMKNLINMVLDVRKMEVGESKLQIQPYALNQWIEHVSQDFVSEGEAKNVRIRYQLDPQVNTVSFDKDKCEIILSNLLINALKHSPQDAEITITSELLSEKNSVRISIIDRGNGLKQVNTQKLFTRFYQGTGEQSGTGIGLSYSRILVELHGGSIGARDNQEAGATFFFELPLRQQSEEIVCQPKAYLNELMNDDSKEQLPEKNTFDTSPYSILVVDDNPDLTDFLKKSLGEYFKRVVIASDGVEALQLTRNHAPDIIVSDVMMPEMNGFELCRRVKSDMALSHIPVILLTALSDDSQRLYGFEGGADEYIQKPFNIEIVKLRIIKLLEERNRLREVFLKESQSPAGLSIETKGKVESLDDLFMRKFIALIEENYSDPDFSIEKGSEKLGLSRVHLYRKVKELSGITPTDFLRNYRLKKASALLKQRSGTISEVAYATGFGSPAYFSKCFKAVYNITPTEFIESL